MKRQRRLWRIAGRRFRRRRRRGRRTSPGGGRRRTSRAFSTGACDDTRTRNSVGWRRPGWAAEEEGPCQESSSQEGSGKEKGAKEAGQKSGQEASPESDKEERRPQERPPLTIQGNHQDEWRKRGLAAGFRHLTHFAFLVRARSLPLRFPRAFLETPAP